MQCQSEQLNSKQFSLLNHRTPQSDILTLLQFPEVADEI